RAMTLGVLRVHKVAALVGKEGLLGLLNGMVTGGLAGSAMYVLEMRDGNPAALTLGLVTLVAMAGSCFVAGVAGSLVPVILRRFGADPATASSIFLTSLTDATSMGSFLLLATWLVL